MYHEKRYVQFNDLVFDGYDMISEYDETTGYKTSTQAYSYAHGSYAPLKNEYMLVSEGSVTLTLTLHTKKLPCEYREFYVRFAEQELGRAGKLWAIKNNEVIWAYALPRNVHQIRSNQQNRVEYDIEFLLPEGVWHKANKEKTFVLPYDVCSFMECKGFERYDECDCCTACQENKFWADYRDRCFCCCVDEITEDMALCYHTKDIQKFYGCDTPFQLVYDCASADRFKHHDFLGQKLCMDDACDDNIIAGRFYANTDIPTDNVTVIIKGKMKNPSININGNINIIKGTYDGALIVKGNGDVYYQKDECCDPTLLSPSVWEIPSTMEYGWTVYPQMNSIIVNLNVCCQIACVYIQYDGLTT